MGMKRYDRRVIPDSPEVQDLRLLGDLENLGRNIKIIENNPEILERLRWVASMCGDEETTAGQACDLLEHIRRNKEKMGWKTGRLLHVLSTRVIFEHSYECHFLGIEQDWHNLMREFSYDASEEGQ